MFFDTLIEPRSRGIDATAYFRRELFLRNGGSGGSSTGPRLMRMKIPLEGRIARPCPIDVSVDGIDEDRSPAI
ncbi:hypothetical protein [Bradyrhizobium sp. CB3481]|uniref:hypothetical protein n=1 Tax=Bradyrhizobium sp. CB3481 TaxID=3039158 RepID=UPI0024B1348B|nr:hypothetical protein [Bradyrhizobium sp. CB3481]WFU20795.1 hypothetical protein QA643_10110 [Bradyrhizobium sp. CB3481]